MRTRIMRGRVAVVAVLALAAGAGCREKKQAPAPVCVARVKDECIEKKLLRQTFRFVTLREPKLRDERAARFALEGLIDRELLAQEAEKQGITVTQADVDAAYANGLMYVTVPGDMSPPALGLDAGVVDVHDLVPEAEKQKKEEENISDEEAFTNWIKILANSTPEEFKAWQTREILAYKMKQRIRDGVKLSDEDAYKRFVEDRTAAVLDVVRVPPPWVADYALKIDPAEIDAWAAAHPERLEVPVRHILIGGKTPEELAQAKTKAEELLGRIKKGEDFATLAREFSEDPGSKEEGGLYAADMVKSFVPEFQEAVKKLKPGEVAPEPVKTSFGYHLIKREPATAEVREKAYRTAKAEDLANDIANDIQAMAASGKTLAQAADAAVAKYGKYGKGPAAAKADPQRPKVETLRPRKRGNNSLPVPTQDAAQSLLKFAFTSPAGTLAPKAYPGALVVFNKGVQIPTKEDFEKERATYFPVALAAKQREEVLATLKKWREQYKDEITIDEDKLWPKDGGAGDGG